MPSKGTGVAVLIFGRSLRRRGWRARKNRAAKATGPSIFLSVELSFFLFSFFVEAGLLNCINRNPVPRGTRNHSHEALLNSGVTSGESRLHVALGDRAKRHLSEHRAPAACSACAEDKLKLSDDVIEATFTSATTMCQGLFTRSAILVGVGQLTNTS